MSNFIIPDLQARQQALDTANSYAVQAPAGSGKTELLSLRTLSLLSLCEMPEEILSITFTKKAANEMRNRIFETLEDALNAKPGATDESAHQQQKNLIASKVLLRDQQMGWNLLQNPERLKIQTIDGFCSFLSSQLPVLSGFGGATEISGNIEDLYSEAVRKVLSLLDSSSDSRLRLSKDIAVLLQHLDNDLAKVESLMVNLLNNRDQWLSHMIDIGSSPEIARTVLQSNLEELLIDSITTVKKLLEPHTSGLLELVHFAASNLRENNSESPILNPSEFSSLPSCGAVDLPAWTGIVELLLTTAGEWRKSYNIKLGFPAPGSTSDAIKKQLYKEKKAQILALVGELSVGEDALEHLQYLRRLPEPKYTEEQWLFLSSLTNILPTLIAQLSLTFSEHSEVDYTHVSSSAIMAMGDDDAPTDIALALDYRIKHILVDEFQDTSSTQVALLEKLTNGWQNGDGRTLFIVGDGMQSCYGFRNANVGLFLKARSSGIGELNLKALDLKANFRSHSGVIAWVNRFFRSAFPCADNISRGAVRYTESIAVDKNAAQQCVTTTLLLYQDEQINFARQSEASQVREIIQSIRSRSNNDSIAILVRNRSHLARVVPELRDAGIPIQATDIDPLSSLPGIEDLTSLTRALCNPADRIAWLAILRAPWCGLTTSDLHALCNHATDKSIWFNLEDYQHIESLSGDALQRLNRVVPVLARARRVRQHLPLRKVVESTWLLLGGASVVSGKQEIECVAAFFQLLEEHCQYADITNIAHFQRAIQNAYIPTKATDQQSNPVHIMTIHKAKGLEFDHVLVPALDRKARNDDLPLLIWHERLNRNGVARLFLSPLSATGDEPDPLYKLLRFEQQKKAELENTRLLYIAVTRARKSVNLLASVKFKGEKELKPAKSSLLASLWPQLSDLESPDPSTRRTLATAVSEASSVDGGQQQLALGSERSGITPTVIRRLISGWKPRFTHQDNDINTQPTEPKTEELHDGESITASALSSAIGTLIHRALQSYVLEGVELLSEQRLVKLRQYWSARLAAVCKNDEELCHSRQFIEDSIKKCTSDPHSNWIFNAELHDSQCEYPVSTVFNGTVRTFVIDRTFVDSDSRRWIIDYKSARKPQGTSTEEFVNSQIEQHRSQLRTYRSVFCQLETRPVKTAILLTDLPLLVDIA